MFISQTAEYAIRAMSALAILPEGKKIRATDLGQATGIPAPYLSKILRRLVLANLLVSRKGQGGGFSLARPPVEIPFIEILDAIDAFPAEGRCAFGWGNCDQVTPCPLHGTWSRLSKHLRDWANDSNLAEVAEAAKADQRVELFPDLR
ncbi:MAG: Rrf2 family transcriptional regulator [Deltaproteobacteria bacterium]|nr:Rrf2 family transcriptional regulator [Deltaproteobacteria bacterium]MBW2692786.1 Rrf2 family transcriptional regulator [Deltaproteobacteria bacterium]